MAPLPPLPENNTLRTFLEYTSRGRPHTMQLRWVTGTTVSEALTSMAGLATDLAELMLTTDSFTGARYSAAGSLISLPATWTPVFGSQSATAGEEDPESYFYSVVGRDIVEGRRVAYFFYATRAGNARAGNNRYAAGSNAEIDIFRDAIVARSLNGAVTTHLATIAGTEAVINGYTNVANSAYWQRRQRRT